MNFNQPLQFIGQNSWIGRYSEANEHKAAGDPKYKHLSAECSICLSDYLPDEQVVVLSCAHGLHERCFAPWERQVCPFDQTPASGVQKVIILGKELLVPPRAQKFAIWASSQAHDRLQLEFKKSLEKMIEDDPTLLENPEEFQKQLQLGIEICQEVLNMYEGTVDDAEIDAKAMKVADLIASLKFFKQNITAWQAVKGLNFMACMALSVFSPKTIQDFANQAKDIINQATGLELDYDRTIQLIRYAVTTLTMLESKSDDQSYVIHFKAIRALSTDKEKKAYLEKLNEAELSSLLKLAQGGGPTSLAIQRLGKEIETKRDVKNQLGALACFVVISAWMLSLARVMR